jgi:hypothetical protein
MMGHPGDPGCSSCGPTPREGQIEAVIERFKKHGVDLFKKHGIEVIGFWTPRDEKDGKGKTVVYMIAWPDFEAAKAAWKSFGGDADRKRIWAEYNQGRRHRRSLGGRLPRPARHQPHAVRIRGESTGPVQSSRRRETTMSSPVSGTSHGSGPGPDISG